MTEPTVDEKAYAWDKVYLRLKTTVFPNPTIRELADEILGEMDDALLVARKDNVTCRNCRYSDDRKCLKYDFVIENFDDWCALRDVRE